MTQPILHERAFRLCSERYYMTISHIRLSSHGFLELIFDRFQLLALSPVVVFKGAHVTLTVVLTLP